MAKRTNNVHRELIAAAQNLRDQTSGLTFTEPVTHVYNPLQYAWDAHAAYIERANPDGIRTLFMGMNPGPWGMAQTGVPFGEINAVKSWIGINKPVGKPQIEHPKRVIEGFHCSRSEVSGRRLWGLFRDRFGQPAQFFQSHFVTNFCPLVFMEASARNRTPDKLPKEERGLLDRICLEHLTRVIEILKPEYLVGVGAYAEKQIQMATAAMETTINTTRILHPSPASPAANRDWQGTATKQLIEAGIWS